MGEEQAKEQTLYPVTECLSIIKGMFETPEYTQLTMTAEAWVKLMCLINLVGEYEISGFGRIVDGKIIDFDIIEQEVQPAYVESDAEAITNFLMRLPEEQISEWKLDWHSHVNMGVTPSGTDTANYAKMFEARMGKQFPFMIVNKKGDITLKQYISPTRAERIEIFLEDKKLSDTDIDTIYNDCKRLVQLKCAKPEPRVTVYNATEKYYGNQQKNERKGFFGGKSGNGATINQDNWYQKYYDRYDNYNNYYGYDYDYYYEDDEVIEAKKQGYEFDDAEWICSECGKPLNSKSEEEMEWGLCSSCLKIALNQYR